MFLAPSLNSLSIYLQVIITCKHVITELMIMMVLVLDQIWDIHENQKNIGIAFFVQTPHFEI